mgnify:CR=1 FL=1|jgi:hypothetical protein
MNAAAANQEAGIIPVVTGDRVEVLVKSPERVRAYGEVFTPAEMVSKMLDLVAFELETGPGFVDRTFFEPAAGDGNFLVAILRRKLAAIEKRYQPAVQQAESLFALASIYGVELLTDNHEAAQEAMLDEFVAFHQRHNVACGPRTDLFHAARFLIATNVLQGDTLTGLDPHGSKLTFSWWNRVLNVPATVQREVFTLASLRADAAFTLDFDVHPIYAPSRIDRVHKEVRVYG